MKDLLNYKEAWKFFISQFKTQKIKLQIDMHLSDWIAGFFDHQYLQKAVRFFTKK